MKKNVKKQRIIYLIFIIIWALLVFYFSNQEADTSTDVSIRFAYFFTDKYDVAIIIEPYLRKIAHYLEYFIGGILFTLLFSTYELTDKRIIVSSSLTGLWYAIFDEIHQLMVPGRAGRIVDVYIDTLGVATGTFFALIIIKILIIIINKKRKM